MLEPGKNPEIDEAVWQAWLRKNKAQDRFRYQRRLKVVLLTAVFTSVSALLWKLLG